MALVASNVSSPLMDDRISFLPLTATALAKVEPFPIEAKYGSAMSDVSTTCSGLDAIFNRTASSGIEGGRPCWTKAKVLKLGTDLLEGYSDPSFQEQLQALIAAAPSEREVPGRMELAQAVQSKVLPKYGFEATPEGVDEMVKIDMAWLPVRNSAVVEEDTAPPVRPEVRTLHSGGLSSTVPKPVAKPTTGSSPSLSKAQVLELLGELLKNFSSHCFQSELKQLLAENHTGNDLEVPGRRDLVMKVQSKVLPKYGLPGTSYGAMLMLDSFTPFLDDFLVNYLIADMDDKLGLPKDTTASMCRGSFTKAADKQELRKPVVEEPCKDQKLTREQVLALANELLDGFRVKEFQEELQSLIKGCSKAELRPRRAELALKVQSKVLPKYGFAGTTLGVMQMLEAFAPHAGDWMVARLVSQIDEKLGLPAETTLTTLYSFSA
eukprot:CAMPEP_0169167692 /NCGR_PEP_ID=MMETSP1015-20121227/60609_1 /TAXON_ID=342587 /ORGANISM="Karlodinium micrum, Strain CCMP2283" /LENGTH=435 /DNA_ID=CAMNT_0009240423 /DNA_START=78 /DNA_END=1386 /DNA_ORIENTATION=-